MDNATHAAVSRALKAKRWWGTAAADAVLAGRYTIIPARRGDGPYLARFWLTPPRIGADGPSLSASVVLHWFAAADDDGALHSHPCPFRTTLLSGGYDEFLPPEVWERGRRVLGPAYGARVRRVEAGTTVEHKAADLHAVGRVDPDTWTLVTTGPRERDWDFHPPGRRAVPWRAFLDAVHA